MGRIAKAAGDLINKLPQPWRKKIVLWSAIGGVSYLVRLIWGPGVLLAALIVISFVGWFLYRYGVRGGRYASHLLGNVWDYFKGAILFALLPAAWPAFKELLSGDRVSGLIQLLMLALIAAVVFEQFSHLPRSWDALTGGDGRGRKSRRTATSRRHRSRHSSTREP